MPRLRDSARIRHVEADLDDLVVRPEHRFGNSDDPRVGRKIDKAADILRMNLDVMPLRPATNGTARALQCVRIKVNHLQTQLLDPLPFEDAFPADDPIAV